MLTGDQILQQLNEAHLTFSDIARLLNVTPQHVWGVAHRARCSRRIAKALAIALGKPFAEVFSDQPQYHKHADQAARAQHIQAAREALTAAGYRLANTREASR